MKQLSAVVVGEGAFVLSCLKLFQNKNININLVISKTRLVKRFAYKFSIRAHDSMNTIFELPPENQPDILISAANANYIGNNILKLVKINSFNFHPSLLPKYAGVRSASWAILNQETIFGSSWHVMNDVLDGGGIVAQAEFSIQENDTAFSLMVKAYENGVLLLGDIIEAVKVNNLQVIQQQIEKRSFYKWSDGLGKFELLTNEKTAEDVSRIVRATYNGFEVDSNFSMKILLC